jgi:hypothetical protein
LVRGPRSVVGGNIGTRDSPSHALNLRLPLKVWQ